MRVVAYGWGESLSQASRPRGRTTLEGPDFAPRAPVVAVAIAAFPAAPISAASDATLLLRPRGVE